MASCIEVSACFIFSFKEKGTNVHYLMGADGNPWTWVLGESDEDASEDEKERSKLQGGA